MEDKPKRQFSEEHRRLIGEANKRRGGLSAETKEKIRQKAIGRKRSVPPVNKKEHIMKDGIPHKDCCQCKEIKTLESFSKSKGRWDGLYNICKICAAENRKKFYKENHVYREHARERSMHKHRGLKTQAIIYKDCKCSRCSYAYQPGVNEGVFEFHHIDPSQKDFNVTAKGYKLFERIKPELDKCVMLCANCHRLVHRELRDAKNEKAPSLESKGALKK